MGYTHRFTPAEHVSPSLWEEFCAVTRRVIATAAKRGIALGDHDGVGDPVVDDDSILLNGAGDEGYEALGILRSGGGESFCKTGRDKGRPYDAAVTAILAIGKCLGVFVDVDSDGTEAEWAPGLELASEAAGAPIAFPESARLRFFDLWDDIDSALEFIEVMKDTGSMPSGYKGWVWLHQQATKEAT